MNPPERNPAQPNVTYIHFSLNTVKTNPIKLLLILNGLIPCVTVRPVHVRKARESVCA